MPTYNKYHQTSLSLYSLSKQTFPQAEYEVILVDDASSDDTPNIFKEADVPFKFKYIRMKQNKGRSSVRNIGINHAEGNLLIFLDGEMLAPPSFIKIIINIICTNQISWLPVPCIMKESTHLLCQTIMKIKWPT